MSRFTGFRKMMICGTFLFCTFAGQTAAFSSEPNNAALLYYQAFLEMPDIDFQLIDPVRDGAEPNDMVRDYMKSAAKTIKIVETASKITNCDWGFMRLEEEDCLSRVTQKIRFLIFLLDVDVRILAADGSYRAALESSLNIRLFANNLDEQAMLMYSMSLASHMMSFTCIQHILGLMSADIDTLAWLQDQLSNVQGEQTSVCKSNEIELSDAIEFLRNNPDDLVWWKNWVSQRIEDEVARQEFLNLTDEELLTSAYDTYSIYMQSVNSIINNDMTYQQKAADIQQLVDELGVLVQIGEPVAILTPFTGGFGIPRVFEIYIRSIVYYNAVRASIEIYSVKAETGQLPQEIPDYVPKDPLSGLEFDYEITQDGFILRCEEKIVGDDEFIKYEFKVKK